MPRRSATATTVYHWTASDAARSSNSWAEELFLSYPDEIRDGLARYRESQTHPKARQHHPVLFLCEHLEREAARLLTQRDHGEETRLEDPPQSPEHLEQRMPLELVSAVEVLRAARATREAISLGAAEEAALEALLLGAAAIRMEFWAKARLGQRMTRGRPPNAIGTVRLAISLARARGATTWHEVPRIWARATQTDGGFGLEDGRVFRLCSEPDDDLLEWEAIEPWTALRVEHGTFKRTSLKIRFSEKVTKEKALQLSAIR